METETVVEYKHNNSGGSWRLTDKDWYRLADAGWKVDWYTSRNGMGSFADADGRFLGALAGSATRRGLSLNDAIDDWCAVTGEVADEEGCSCCGPPHYFYEVTD